MVIGMISNFIHEKKITYVILFDIIYEKKRRCLMTIYFWLSACLNVGLLVALIMYVQQIKRIRNRLTVSYFVETNEDKGFFKKTYVCSQKGQLLIDGIPVGGAFTIVEERMSEVDSERINMMLEEYAKPLLDMGMAVVKKIPK